jgi:hypothetical protein
MLFIHYDTSNFTIRKTFENTLIINYLLNNSIQAKNVISEFDKFIKQEQIIETLISCDDKYCIFDTTIDNIRFILSIAKHLKIENKIIIFKGYYATLHRRYLLTNYNYIDMIINGFSFLSYFDLAFAQSLYDVHNISFIDNNNYIETDNKCIWDEIKSISPILNGLYSINDINRYGIYFGFGCVNKCNFCYSKSYYGGYFSREKDTIIKEVIFISNNLKENENTFIKISDNDISKHSDIIDILKQLKKYNYFNFSAQLRLDQINDNFINHLIDSNIKYVSFGLETVDTDLLKRTNKTEHPQEYLLSIKKNIKKLKNKIIGANIILNLPYENNSSVNKTIKFIKKNNIKDLVINYYVDIHNINNKSYPLYFVYNKIFKKYGVDYIYEKSEYYEYMRKNLFERIEESHFDDINSVFNKYVDLEIKHDELEAYKYCKTENEEIIIGNRNKYIKIFSNKYNFLIKKYIKINKIKIINFVKGEIIYCNIINKYSLIILLNNNRNTFTILNNKYVTLNYATMKLFNLSFYLVVNHNGNK